MTTTIQKWGNSQGIRIPKFLLDAVQWSDDEQLVLSADKNKIIIEKAKETHFEQIELQVASENASARHLYNKFGFYETGYIKNGMKYADGTYTKLILMQKDLK